MRVDDLFDQAEQSAAMRFNLLIVVGLQRFLYRVTNGLAVGVGKFIKKSLYRRFAGCGIQEAIPPGFGLMKTVTSVC